MQIPFISASWQGVALTVLVFVFAALIGTATYFYSMRASSVLYRYIEAGNPTKEPAFIVFNPFRDRSPERIAEAFLELMRVGQCEKVMSALPDTPEYCQDICEREKKHPLSSWRLMNRTDEPQKVRMFFHVWKQNHDGRFGPVWVTVEKYGEQWQVARYERWY